MHREDAKSAKGQVMSKAAAPLSYPPSEAQPQREQIERVASCIVDAAIKVHRTLGPGLLESAYQACLARELELRGLRVECEVPLPLEYEGVRVEVGYRLDMRVAGCVVIENKTTEAIAPIHRAQLLTYLKLANCKLGFLLNWNVHLLKDGLVRCVNGLEESP